LAYFRESARNATILKQQQWRGCGETATALGKPKAHGNGTNAALDALLKRCGAELLILLRTVPGFLGC
jgi:hypothetical protein